MKLNLTELNQESDFEFVMVEMLEKMLVDMQKEIKHLRQEIEEMNKTLFGVQMYADLSNNKLEWLESQVDSSRLSGLKAYNDNNGRETNVRYYTYNDAQGIQQKIEVEPKKYPK